MARINIADMGKRARSVARSVPTPNISKPSPERPTLLPLRRGADRGSVPLTILLHGIYLGHDFDGGFRGSTGEFYWHSVIADGNDVSTTNSRDLHPSLVDGIERKVGPGRWLSLSPLAIYSGEQGPKQGALSLGFSVLESDDAKEAARIFEGLGDVAKSIIKLTTDNPNNQAADQLTDSLVKTAQRFLEVDDDDYALQGVKGLLWPDRHYRIGRFFTMTGRKGTRAVFSVAPSLVSNDEDLQFEFEQNISQKTLSMKVTKPGLVSVCIRRDHWKGALPAQFLLRRQEDAQMIGAGAFWRVKHKTYEVVPGTYDLQVISGSPKADVDMMFTAFGETLADK